MKYDSYIIIFSVSTLVSLTPYAQKFTSETLDLDCKSLGSTIWGREFADHKSFAPSSETICTSKAETQGPSISDFFWLKCHF